MRTYGQIAYEAHAEILGLVGDGATPPPWDDLDDDAVNAWMAAGRAVDEQVRTDGIDPGDSEPEHDGHPLVPGHNPAECRACELEAQPGERDAAIVADREPDDALATLHRVEAIINDTTLAYHERWARANQALGRDIATPGKPETGTEWAVFWGGPDPDDCAGWEAAADEASAAEDARWRITGGYARRTVAHGPWEVMPPGPPDGEDVPDRHVSEIAGDGSYIYGGAK